MTTDRYQSAFQAAAQALQALHGGVIVAIRRQYEEANEQRGEAFVLLRQLTDNPAFAWLAPLTELVSTMTSLPRGTVPEASAAADLARTASALISPADDDDMSFYERLRDARSAAPELVTLHAHARAAVGALRDAARHTAAGA